jgi:RNA polymerase sigma factor (sigma-70 family)
MIRLRPRARDSDVEMRPTSTNETDLVVAARAGDRRALDELVVAYLPLVYTLVRRALSGRADADDVVQETMLRALRELPVLRTPESFRPWLVTIAMRQVSTHLRRQSAADRTAPLDEVAGMPDPDADFEDVTLLSLELSEQRRQVVRASRWLDPDDRALLSLWWLEIAGELNRAELAAALGVGVAHVGVRVQRMRHQLEVSRSLVAALDARPRCAPLEGVVAEWDGVPSPLWRKRIARHTRSCRICSRAAGELIRPERLLAGFAVLPVPVALVSALTGKGGLADTVASGASPTALSAASVKVGFFGQLTQTVGAHPVAAAVAAGALVTGIGVAAVTVPEAPPRPSAVVTAPTSPAIRTPTPAPGAVASATDQPSPTAGMSASPDAPGLPLGPISLESVDDAGLVATANDYGVLARIGTGSAAGDRRRATFEVVRGLLNPTCVSFRSRDGRFLRHSSWRLRLSHEEDNRLFRGDATFCVRAGAVPGSVSLESANYPGWFLCRRGNELWVDQPDGTAAFRAGASFRPRPSLAG